jgi:transposase
LHGLRPGYQRQVKRLTGPTFISAAKDLLAGDDSVRAQLTRRRLTRLAELTAEIQEVTALIAAEVEQVKTGLTDVYGLGPVSAATILGEVADIRRYRSRHAFAAANGTAPLPASSGRTTRIGSTGRATVSSTGCSTRSRSLRSAPTPKAGPTTSANAPKERAGAKPFAA